MKVSIITTCYNRDATIRGAIESVLAQDYDDIEYIVVDGASTDGSIEAIRSEELKVKSSGLIIRNLLSNSFPKLIMECMRPSIRVSRWRRAISLGLYIRMIFCTIVMSSQMW